MNKKEPINIMSLIISLLTLIIGIILLFNDSDAIFRMIGYATGAILVLVGIVRLIMTYFSYKKSNIMAFGTLVTSIILITLGIIILIFPKSIMVTISIIIGAIVIFMGIQRLSLGVTIKSVDNKGSIFFIIESILIILVGLAILSQKLTNLFGAFLIVYAITELVSYIYYTSQNKDYSEVLNKKITKEMKESESKDAIIEEE